MRTTTVRELVEPILRDMALDAMFIQERAMLAELNRAIKKFCNDTWSHHEEYIRRTVVDQQEYSIPGALEVLSLIVGIEWDEDETSETYGACTNPGAEMVTLYGGRRVKPLWTERYPDLPHLSAMGR